MSINSLTNTEMKAQTRFARSMPAARAQASRSSAPSAKPGENQVSQSLESLTKYIPTETITLYVAAVAATPALESLTGSRLNGAFIYWFFAVLTPILLVLVLISKRASEQLPLRPERWPIWKMVAASIAFLIWALSIPNNPYTVGNEAAAILAGFGAIFVSSILSLLEPIFERSPV